MNERRRTYRSIRGLDGIHVGLAWSDRQYVACSLLDLSARGAAVTISSENVPSPVLGIPIYMRFDVPGVEPVSGIAATVRNAREENGRHVLGIEIGDWELLHRKLPPAIFSAFNRRRHFRVDIPPDTPTEVSAADTGSERRLTGTVANVSISGCQLLFDLHDAPDKDHRLRLRFSLPSSNFPLDVIGVVRSATAMKTRSRCGVEFENLESRQEQELAQFVMQRQRALRRTGGG